MEIVLLRHGRPAFDFSQKVPGRQLHELVKLYDSAGIVEPAPQHVKEKFQTCDLAVCSDLPRSIESATALGVQQIMSDALYREARLPYIKRGGISLSTSFWAALFRSLWFLGFSANGEPLKAVRERAGQGARRLQDLARENGRVLFVGHGFINYFIARELLASGWLGPNNPGKAYWEYGIYHIDRRRQF